MAASKNKYRVTNKKMYNILLAEVDVLMKKGSANVTTEESAEILAIALALQAYDLKHYPITAPTTLEGIIELKMYEKRLNEKFQFD
ncbi:hypothetical protein [Dyadobacter sp. CY323]|uniref:hypothetical protein n=1 Tax=Dyadobacter sp. CY323 TaxID=2907302 RepID=UPI001F43ADC3|nr:hypothetical protein [Dyadobacter sp. CY323]MCE6988474.1 hypothetical protein [Dyadobacter sp. CY323]